jgi:hypothetical protein
MFGFKKREVANTSSDLPLSAEAERMEPAEPTSPLADLCRYIIDAPGEFDYGERRQQALFLSAAVSGQAGRRFANRRCRQ